MSRSDSNTKLLDFSKSVIAIRYWEEKNLPLIQSCIAFDLLLLIANCHYSDTNLTLKKLFNSLNYSERGVRYVLEQFISNEWCQVVGSSIDKRSRNVVASKKLTSTFEAYQAICLESYLRLVGERVSVIDSSNDESFDDVQVGAVSKNENTD